MSRTKDFNEGKALAAAMFLFWEKGYEATSIQALEQAMGLKRTSIYNAFGNKRELFQKALNCYLDNILVNFIFSMNNAKTTKEAMNNLLTEVIHLHFDKSNPGGCLVVLSLLENRQHDAKTKKILESALYKLRNAIVQRLEQGKKNGEVKPKMDCHTAGNQLTALITGMITLAKAGFPKKELENIINSSINELLQ